MSKYVKNPANIGKIITSLSVIIAVTAGIFLYFGVFNGDINVENAEDGKGTVINIGEVDAAGKAGGRADVFSSGVGIESPGGGEEYGNSTEGIVVVDVAGAVVSPAVVTLLEGSRVFEAIDAAGGPGKGADMRNINKASVLQDGDRVYVPTKEEYESGNAPASGGSGIPGTNNGNNAKININTADETALQALTGVGPVTAKKIIDYRTQNGKFRSIEDLKKVSGIGPKTFEKMKDDIII